MTVIGCDPGYEESAVVSCNATGIVYHMQLPNDRLLDTFRARTLFDGTVLVIERIESYGMAVGRETFETVYASGQFAEAFQPNRVERLSRKDVKLHLCGSVRATDSNIRQALIDRFGPTKEKAFGTKKNPGPLYGITGHKLSALAVALTWIDKQQAQTKEF